MLLDLIFSEDFNVWVVISSIIASLLVIFISLPIHEWAHAFVSNKLGDPTAKYMGRLSLNPLKHIDPMGAAMILLIGFGWAKPVPVEMHRFKRPKPYMALTALAGPISNLILALIANLITNTILAVAIGVKPSSDIVVTILYFIITVLQTMAYINVSLAVFNLIPIPPLDGSRILNAFLPDRIYYKLMQYERYFFIIIFALVYLLDNVFGSLVSSVFGLVSNIAQLPFLGIF